MKNDNNNLNGMGEELLYYLTNNEIIIIRQIVTKVEFMV